MTLTPIMDALHPVGLILSCFVKAHFESSGKIQQVCLIPQNAFNVNVTCCFSNISWEYFLPVSFPQIPEGRSQITHFYSQTKTCPNKLSMLLLFPFFVFTIRTRPQITELPNVKCLYTFEAGQLGIKRETHETLKILPSIRLRVRMDLSIHPLSIFPSFYPFTIY